MTTRNQHYYPKSLIKHFSNEKKNVLVYIRQINKIKKLNYKKVCVSRDTYESEEQVDNILENKLSKYEAKIGAIIKYIIDNFYKNDFLVTEDEKDFIYQYMWLQYIRTDSGRINTMNILLNKEYTPREKPIELDEIERNRCKIKQFNYIFKKPDTLEKFLNLYKRPKSMKMHIAISSENLLTSDNPVIGTDNWKQIIMPINPNICIEFQDESINCSENLLVRLEKKKIQYINEAIINTTNYYVISNEKFTFSQQCYIYNRFNNKNWEFGYPHF